MLNCSFSYSIIICALRCQTHQQCQKYITWSFPDFCLKSSITVLKTEHMSPCNSFRRLPLYYRGNTLLVSNIHGSNLFLINIMHTLYNITGRLQHFSTSFQCFGIFLFTKQVLEIFFGTVLNRIQIIFKMFVFQQVLAGSFL